MRAQRTGVAAMLILAFALAIDTARGAEVRDFLDRRTGTTLRISRDPWVLALEQPSLAAHARDYVALYALEASNAGRKRTLLAAFYWSTVPGRNDYAGDSPPLRLLVEDRDVRLEPVASPREAGVADWPLRPPGRDAQLVLYDADPSLLRHLGHARQLRLRGGPDSGLAPQVWFEVWRDGSAAFRRFAGEVLPGP